MRFTDSAHAVYEYLSRSAIAGRAIEFQARIADVTGYSDRQVRRALKELADAGIIRVEVQAQNWRKRLPNHYIFLSAACPTLLVHLSNSTSVADSECVIVNEKTVDAPVEVASTPRALPKGRAGYVQQLHARIRRARYVRKYVDEVMKEGAAIAFRALGVLRACLNRGNVMDAMRYRALSRALGVG